MTRALINALCKGLDAEGWRIVGYGGAWARAVRPLELYIEKRVAKAVSAEREACAKVCEVSAELIWEYHPEQVKTVGESVCINLAAAIRARGENK